MTFYHSESTVKKHIEHAKKLIPNLKEVEVMRVKSAIHSAKDKKIPIEKRIKLLKEVISNVSAANGF